MRANNASEQRPAGVPPKHGHDSSTESTRAKLEGEGGRGMPISDLQREAGICVDSWLKWVAPLNGDDQT